MQTVPRYPVGFKSIGLLRRREGFFSDNFSDALVKSCYPGGIIPKICQVTEQFFPKRRVKFLATFRYTSLATLQISVSGFTVGHNSSR
jgi:hypothetical protein